MTEENNDTTAVSGKRDSGGHPVVHPGVKFVIPDVSRELNLQLPQSSTENTATTVGAPADTLGLCRQGISYTNYVHAP